MLSPGYSDGSRALISREALRHNAGVIRNALARQASLCGVIKADAYGHSAGMVLDALCRRGDGADRRLLDGVAVACLDEAAALPLVSVPVQIFRPVEDACLDAQQDMLELAIRRRWVLTVYGPGALADLARIAERCGGAARVQIMLDTGMGRCGGPLEGVEPLVEHVLRHQALELFGFSTHFACADHVHDPFTLEQLARFRQATENDALRKGLSQRRVVRHAANSAAVFYWPQTHLDMVRCGIALYGIAPTGEPDEAIRLRPAMRWTAPLLAVKQIARGMGVGYGLSYRAAGDMRVGLVPVGYADGYLRCFSNRGIMQVRGRPAPVIGRVSMDQVTINLSEVPMACPGDEVTVMDDDPRSPCSVYALADWAGTIPYEIVCRIGPRVRRTMVEGATARVSVDEAENANSAQCSHASIAAMAGDKVQRQWPARNT